MLRETERTRAIRRAQHDSYAPYYVRPAVRSDRDPLWESVGRCVNIAFAVTIAMFALRLVFFLVARR